MASPTRSRTVRIVLLVALLAVAAIVWQVTDGPRGWTTNQARIEAGAEHSGLEPRRFPASPEQLFDAVFRFSEESPLWTLVGHSDDGVRTHLVLERKTRLFRFVDDVSLQLTPDGKGTVVTGASSSRVGKGDLGQNARNLRELLEATERELRENPPAAP